MPKQDIKVITLDSRIETECQAEFGCFQLGLFSVLPLTVASILDCVKKVQKWMRQQPYSILNSVSSGVQHQILLGTLATASQVPSDKTVLLIPILNLVKRGYICNYCNLELSWVALGWSKHHSICVLLSEATEHVVIYEDLTKMFCKEISSTMKQFKGYLKNQSLLVSFSLSS